MVPKIKKIIFFINYNDLYKLVLRRNEKREGNFRGVQTTLFIENISKTEDETSILRRSGLSRRNRFRLQDLKASVETKVKFANRSGRGLRS